MKIRPVGANLFRADIPATTEPKCDFP